MYHAGMHPSGRSRPSVTNIMKLAPISVCLSTFMVILNGSESCGGLFLHSMGELVPAPASKPLESISVQNTAENFVFG